MRCIYIKKNIHNIKMYETNSNIVERTIVYMKSQNGFTFEFNNYPRIPKAESFLCKTDT